MRGTWENEDEKSARRVGDGQMISERRMMSNVGDRWRCWGGRSVAERSGLKVVT